MQVCSDTGSAAMEAVQEIPGNEIVTLYSDGSVDVHKSIPLKKVIIFTDGAAVPNPGAGGYGVVISGEANQNELSGGFRRTTNNRMELMAVIIGLEALKERRSVTVYSDSQYVVERFTSGSVFRWRANGWKFSARAIKLVKNPDLWERLLTAYEKHEVEMVWVRGHTGLPGNERCDALAMAACQLSDLPPDPGFIEKTSKQSVAEKTSAKSVRKGTVEGQLCRHCGTPVVRQVPRMKLRKGQAYYYEWYLRCPVCNRLYLVKEAKRYVGDGDGPAGRDA